jgi:hypothetical protein
VLIINAALAVVLTLLQFKWCLALAHVRETSDLAGTAIVLPILFIIQYVISRMIMLGCAFGQMDEGHAFLAAAVSLFLTFIMYFVAGAIARNAAARCRVEFKRPRGFLEAATIIAVCIFLGSIFMPSLSRVRAMAQRVAYASSLHQLDVALKMSESDYLEAPTGKTGKVGPRVRRYFPETLLWRPELITDDQGQAALELTTADSITTWRMNVDAVSAAGRLGNCEVGIRVFQDFFVDLDGTFGTRGGASAKRDRICHVSD